jgi:DNA-binding NtrC family response regulator
VLIQKSRLPLGRVSASRGRSLTIALVTEDDDLREACARALRGNRHVVLAARHSGHAMLTCLGGQRIDVLVSELSMADGSGPALARRMQRHSPAMKAIYLARAGTSYQSANVLIRPFTRDDLLSRLALL